MENFPYFVRNLNPSLYISQIQKFLKEVNQQTFFHKNFHEESSSVESSGNDESTFSCDDSSSPDESSSIDYEVSNEESSSSIESSGDDETVTCCDDSAPSPDESSSIDSEVSDEESSSSIESSVEDETVTCCDDSAPSPDESSSIDYEVSNEESSSSIESSGDDEPLSSSDEPSSLGKLSGFVVVSAILGALATTLKNDDHQSTDTESSSMDEIISDEEYFLPDEESSSSSSSSQEYMDFSQKNHIETAQQTEEPIFTEQTKTENDADQSDSLENQSEDTSTNAVSTDEVEDEKENHQHPKQVNPLPEGPEKANQELLENHRVSTDNSDKKEKEHHQRTHDSFSFSSEHDDNVNEIEEKVGLVRLFESLPSNYPVRSIITNGTEIYVSFFIQYVPDQQLVYFFDDENVISIESHRIDGIIFANDVDYESDD